MRASVCVCLLGLNLVCACPTGSYLNLNTCQACPPGSVSFSTSALACYPCPVGTYAASNNSACLPCPLFTTSPLASDTVFLCLPIGGYYGSAGSQGLPCPVFYFCPASASRPLPCLANNLAGQSTCNQSVARGIYSVNASYTVSYPSMSVWAQVCVSVGAGGCALFAVVYLVGLNRANPMSTNKQKIIKLQIV